MRPFSDMIARMWYGLMQFLLLIWRLLNPGSLFSLPHGIRFFQSLAIRDLSTARQESRDAVQVLRHLWVYNPFNDQNVAFIERRLSWLLLSPEIFSFSRGISKNSWEGYIPNHQGQVMKPTQACNTAACAILSLWAQRVFESRYFSVACN